MAPAKAARNYELGKNAYGLYRDNLPRTLPRFKDLKPEEKEAWEAVAEGILQQVVDSTKTLLKSPK